VVVLNKCDLGAAFDDSSARAMIAGGARAVVRVSARTGEGLESLGEAVATALGAEPGVEPAGLGGAVANPRHVEALDRARAALDRAADAARDGQPGEIVSLELRESLAAIGEVTGQGIGDDLLDRIFGRFCIGK